MRWERDISGPLAAQYNESSHVTAGRSYFMSRNTTLGFTLVLLAASGSIASHGEMAANAAEPVTSPFKFAPTLHVRTSNLPRTLVATRSVFRNWQRQQATARQLVSSEPWLATPQGLASLLDDVVWSTRDEALSAKLPDGRPLWNRQAEWKDGTVFHLATGTSKHAVFLKRVIHAQQATCLTVGIGGGNRLDVWLNRQHIVTANTHLHIGRYGCGQQMDGTRVDQLLIDLDLAQGENELVLRFTPAQDGSCYFSSKPDPTPRLWQVIRQDFPADRHPLLRKAPAQWFRHDGWFAAQNAGLERELVSQLLPECGDDSATLQEKSDRTQQGDSEQRDGRWLEFCTQVAAVAEFTDASRRLAMAVTELSNRFPQEYPAEKAELALKGLKADITALAGTDSEQQIDSSIATIAELITQMQRQWLVAENPLINQAEILFVKRYTYNSKHYYDDFQHISRWGGQLCQLSMKDGHVRSLVPEMSDGVFDRYDLSFDASKIAFGYRRPKHEGFRLYELELPRNQVRQLTLPPSDEDERIAAYGKTSTGDSFYGLLGYRFWTDDVHPCYLPDGGICFASTRSEHGVLCTPNHYLACTNLFRMDDDRNEPRPLSAGALSEFTPTVMDDGRILYNRWEYVYKGIAAVQSLWTTRPDGSGSEEIYGDNVTNPGVLWQARQVPGHPRLVVCVGCGHEPLGVGQILLLNLDRDKRTAQPMTSLTPHVRTQGLRGLFQLRNGEWREDIFGPFYADPFPLSDKFFLVSCNPDQRYNDQAAYGIYLLDTFGNRVPIYDDPQISCWQPMLLAARSLPPTLSPTRTVLADKAMMSSAEGTDATVFLSDVYEGLEDVPRGTVKYLRVLEQVPKPWAAEVDQLRREDRSADGFGGHLVISHNTHIWVVVNHGVVPVHADGSAFLQVPAGRNLFFQALDENFMEVQRMRTFVNFTPGENRSCIGCHEHRHWAPQSRPAIALENGAMRLEAEPGAVAPRPLDYVTDIQPILDRHCVKCHSGDQPDTRLDLRGELTTLFNRSYENILQAGLVDAIQEWNGAAEAMQHAVVSPPYSHGSHRSRLIALLQTDHYETNLNHEEWIKLVTWIDCGAPYYGSYFGRRHIRYRGQPDFRPTPTVEAAWGTPPEFPQLQQPAPIPAELLLHWTLDETSPDALSDSSGQQHIPRVMGTTVDHRGSGNLARRFDGDDYLTADLDQYATLSIALWVRADGLRNRWNPLLFCNGAEPGAVHFSLLSDGTPNVALHSGNWNWTHCRADRAIKIGDWHHLALVCDARLGGRVKFYLDGQCVGDQYLGLGLDMNLSRFRIGSWDGWDNEPANQYQGCIDDVRIFRGLLTAEQIADIALTNNGG
jgi:hypothetical protein